jgi:hypothetical protein
MIGGGFPNSPGPALQVLEGGVLAPSGHRDMRGRLRQRDSNARGSVNLPD